LEAVGTPWGSGGDAAETLDGECRVTTVIVAAARILKDLLRPSCSHSGDTSRHQEVTVTIPDAHGENDLPRLIDIPTLAQHLSDSVRHVRRLVDERRIPFIKVGHFIRFDPADIDAWVRAAKVPVVDDRASGSTTLAAWIGDRHQPPQPRP
jgi:excisionase family DNA binding protein